MRKMKTVTCDECDKRRVPKFECPDCGNLFCKQCAEDCEYDCPNKEVYSLIPIKK